ncbi:hypothetical protein BGZ76_001234, partial [Entomortierella beljakovae]
SMTIEKRRQPQPFQRPSGYLSHAQFNPELDIIHISTYHDATIAKDIVLWDDILSVFKNAETDLLLSHS